jgi:hypothetical protein
MGLIASGPLLKPHSSRWTMCSTRRNASFVGWFFCANGAGVKFQVGRESEGSLTAALRASR